MGRGSGTTFGRRTTACSGSVGNRRTHSLCPILLRGLSRVPFRSTLSLKYKANRVLGLVLRGSPRGRLYNVSLSRRVLTITGSGLPRRIGLLLKSDRTLPFPSGTFSIICYGSSFRRCPTPRGILERMGQMLGPNNAFLVKSY